MRLLITGDAGFVGSNATSYFLKHGHDVTVFNSFTRPGTEKNLAWLQTQVQSGLGVLQVRRGIRQLAQWTRDNRLLFR